MKIKGVNVNRGDLILVTWWDYSTDAQADPSSVEPILCITAGWFHGKKTLNGQPYIATGLTYHPNESKGQYTGGDTYLLRCVEKVEVLRKTK